MEEKYSDLQVALVGLEVRVGHIQERVLRREVDVGLPSADVEGRFSGVVGFRQREAVLESLDGIEIVAGNGFHENPETLHFRIVFVLHELFGLK